MEGGDKLLMWVCKRERMLPESSVASFLHLCSSKSLFKSPTEDQVWLNMLPLGKPQ